MLTLLAAVLVTLLLGGGIAAILYLTQSQRQSSLKHLARHLACDYQSLASLDHETRHAGFRLTTAGQIRHVRHQLSGTFNTLPFKVFDYGMVTPAGVRTQTVIMLGMPKLPSGSLYISKHTSWQTDTFVDQEIVARTALRPLPAGVTPASLSHHQLLSEHPSHLMPLLQNGLLDWLQNHPDVSLEYSNRLLMVYRPGLLIPAGGIESALSELERLHTCLTTPPI